MLKLKIRFALALCVLPCWSLADGILSINNPAKNGQDHQAYATLEAFEGNDSMAMRQYGAQWQGNYSPRRGSNIGLLTARAETGAQWNGFRLGTLYRAEALVQANRDTADLVQQYNQRQGYEIGKTYAVSYQVKAFEASGARLSKRWPLASEGLWTLDIGLGVSYLRGKSIRLETATGQVVTLNAKDIDANITTSNTNSNTNTRDLDAFNAPYGSQLSPSGQGYALDAGVVLRNKDSGLSAELALADWSGRINWSNLPNNVSNYNTATKTYDADGFVIFNPTATRLSSYQQVTQVLDPKVWLALNYAIAQVDFQAASSYTTGYWFPQAGIKYHPSPKWALIADYDFRFSTLGLSVQYQWLHLGIKTNNTNLLLAKAYGLTANVALPF